MNRALTPLTRTLDLGSHTVSFPLTMRSAANAAALIAVPRRGAATLLGGEPLRPVPTGPRQAGMMVVHTAWTDTPAGSFDEFTVLVLAYLGMGSPVPGLATLLHAVTDRSRVVGDYGFVPVACLVDGEEAAAFRRDLWGIPAAVVSIRRKLDGPTATIQADHGGQPVVRMTIHRRAPIRSHTADTTVPLFGHRDGGLWCDVGATSMDQVARRLRPGGGTVAMFDVGPMAAVAREAGVAPGSGASRRSLATALSGAGRVRWQGPRPLDPELDVVASR